MSEAPPRLSPQASSASLCSYRYQVSMGSISRALRTTTSFVTINHKRSFRPPASILSTLVEFFPERVPLAFATSNPTVRLFTESSGSRSGGTGTGTTDSVYRHCLGFVLDGFSITKSPTEPFIAPCDEGGVVEDDTPLPARQRAVGLRAGNSEEEGSLDRSPGSFSVCSTSLPTADGSYADEDPRGAPVHIQAYPFRFAGPCLPSQTSPAEQHYYPFVGYTPHDPAEHMGSAQSLPGGVAALGAGLGGAVASQRHPGGTRASSPPPSSSVGGGPSPKLLAAEMELCDSRCWHSSRTDLCLCASLTCSSPKGLNMVLFSAWWLSRYYGISLTLMGFRQKDQLAVFKEVVRLLSVKDLTCVRCVLSQEWMQGISACSDLISLTFASCEADSDVPLMYVDSILTKQTRTNQQQRLANQSQWYIGGNLSIGLLRHLKCLHIIHTPVNQEFLQVVAAGARTLECLILHKARGITSLDPLADLKSLHCLSLQSSSIDDRGAEALGDCAALHRLFLVECRRILSLDFLQKAVSQSLKQLTLSSNWFSEEHMRAVAACSGLMELQLHSLRRLTSIAPLHALSDLEVVNLSDTAVTVEGTANAMKGMRLTRVNMASCAAVSSISAWVGLQSTTLTSLDLSASGIDEEGLHGVAACTVLRYINLADCAKITSIVALANTPGVRWLSLGGTGVTDADLHTSLKGPLGRCLRVLCLRDCKGIRRLTFLENVAAATSSQRLGSPLSYLDLENTHIRDTDLPCVRLCKWLTYLNMSRCAHLTDVRPLAGLRRLRQLHLSHTAITGDGLGSIAECPALEVLDLRSCRHLSSIAALSGLPALKELLLDGYGQGKAAVYLQHPHQPVRSSSSSRRTHSPFVNEDNGQAGAGSGNGSSNVQPRLHSIRSIGSATSASSAQSALPSPHTGSSNRSSGRARRHSGSADDDAFDTASALDASAAPGEVTLMEALESFSARKSALTEGVLPSLLAASTHLSRLDISECRYVTDLDGLEHLRCLRVLLAAQCPGLSNKAIATISQFPYLQYLSLSGCTGFTDLSPLGLLQHLEQLDASFTRVADDGLLYLGRAAGLKWICLSECRQLTSVRPLATLSFLRELHLESTAVTDAGVSALVHCGCLQRLYLTKCKKITDVTELAAGLRQLEVLDVYGTSIPSRVAGEPRSSACAVM